jgi:cell division inhibitor SulA
MLNIASAPTRHTPTFTTGGGITEIVLPNARSSAVYLPSLAFLSREGVDRWLTWLVPQGIAKSALQHYGFDLAKTRFVYPKNQEQCFAFMRGALAEGNSHTVVGNPGKLTDEQIAHLEQAALRGQCYGLLLRERLSH